MNDETTKRPNPDEEVHEIDGIVELNHPAPFWWQAIYYASIVWAIGYAGYYLSGAGRTLNENLVAELARFESKRAVAAVPPEKEREELRAILGDGSRIAEARAVFAKNCASCHAADGGGGIGPNLTDAAWIHGDGSTDAILKVVREGVAEKGMPPWGPLLKREEVVSAAAFVRSIRGTAPAKPKPAQGNPVKYGEDG